MKALLRAGLTAATICLAISSARALPVCAPMDFNADCKSDIVWRNVVTGQNYFYPMNGTAVLGTEGFSRTVPDLNWQMAGTGDFDGDGRADILWRNALTGENYIYFLDGPTIVSEGNLRTVADPNWTVAGIGDFNGDGRADILWRNALTGENYIYFLNGLTVASEGSLRTVADPNWTVAGIGDFNGDGKADILWRNAATGENYIYFLNGLTIVSEGNLRTVPAGTWQVKGIGDFDGDGKADILWRNAASGENYIYFLNGLTIAWEGYVRTVADLNWITTPPATLAEWAQYAGLDVGAPALAGRTNVITAGSAYDVTAAGSDISATSDQFHFAYKLESGNFDLRVRVASLTAVDAWSKAGLMARESMELGSREVSVFATPAGGYEFQYRPTTGVLMQKVDSVAQVSYPNTWVRLRRAGTVFTSYTSADGSNWAQFGTTTLALPATVFLGMATTSHNVAQTALAQYRNLTTGSALPDTTPPSVPGGLAAVAASTSQINLSWSASSDNTGVAGYKVLRGGVQIATSSALTYAATGLSPSTAYSFTVAAVDAAGNTSAQSTAASATTQTVPDLVAPSIPTGLAASAVTPSSLTLSWSAATDNVGVTGYRVYRDGALVASPSGTSVSITGLLASVLYSFTVSAVDAAGNVSAPSAPLSVTTPVLPPLPQILWSADMETGDLSQWSGTESSGSAQSVAVTAFSAGIPPKTGNWVMRQSVTGSVGGTRMFSYAGIDALAKAGTTFYESWWDYYPAKISFGISDMFSIFQIDSRDSNGVYSPIWDLDFNGSNFTLQLAWSPNNMAPPGPHAGESGKRYYTSTQPVPVGQWVFFEVMIKPAADYTGAVKIWMNGSALFDLTNVKTRFPDVGVGGFMYTEHNAYGSGLTPTPAIHYVDDATVSLGRMPYAP